jgi:hypothetical protein
VQSQSPESAALRAAALSRFAAVRGILENGAVAGVLGALVVALWFFILDFLQSRPFFTPSLLGSVLFSGARPVDVQSVNAIMVFAYTGLHGLLYLIAGTMLAWMVWEIDEHPQFGMILILLFVLSQAVLFGLEVTVVPQLVGVLGAFSVVAANLLSAVAMFWLLLRRHPRLVRNLKAAMEDRS